MRQHTGAAARIWPRAAGFVAGLAIAAGAVALWRVPPGTGTLGADVTFSATPTGELAVAPVEPFLSGRGLMPSGEAARGLVEVRNQTGTRLLIRLRALPSTGDLDDALRVTVQDPSGSSIFRGPLGGLREWSRESLALGSGEGIHLSVRAWLPAAAKAYRGRIENVGLEFLSEPAGG